MTGLIFFQEYSLLSSTDWIGFILGMVCVITALILLSIKNRQVKATLELKKKEDARRKEDAIRNGHDIWDYKSPRAKAEAGESILTSDQIPMGTEAPVGGDKAGDVELTEIKHPDPADTPT